MIKLIPAVVLLSAVLLCPTEAFSTYTGDEDYSQEIGRSTRSDEEITNEKLLDLADRYLTKFDITLAAQVKPFVEKLNGKEKQQFLKDIEEMNEVIEVEIVAGLYGLLENAESSQSDFASSYGEVSKQAINKVVNEYKEKPWMQRIMNFAGNELEATLDKL